MLMAIFQHEAVILFLTAVLILFLLGLAWNWIGGKNALSKYRIRVLHKADCPELEKEIRSMKRKMGLKARIRIGLLDDALPNAFTLFLGRRNYVIVFSVGIFENLEREEIKAVASHEISHIKNKDVLIKSFFVVGRYLQLPTGPLMESFISRHKEFHADAKGALLTRNPIALASALIKMARCHVTQTNQNFTPSPVGKSFLIVDPSWKQSTSIRWKLFSRHPPIEDRVRELITLSKKL
jgi:heat shock protein HtpX